MASIETTSHTDKHGRTTPRYKVRHTSCGTHHQKTFLRKKDAELYRAKVEIEKSQNTAGLPIVYRTVAAACEEFIRYQESRMKEGQIGKGRYVMVKNACDYSIIPRLGNLKMHLVEGLNVEQFFRDMTRLDGLAATTAKGRLSILAAIIEFSRRRRYIKTSPMQDAHHALKGIPRQRVRTFDIDSFRVLLSKLDERGPRQSPRVHALGKCAVLLAAFCGLRLGEILGLKVENLDLDAEMVRVRNSVTIWGEVKGPKSRAGVRDVPIPAALLPVLRAWVESYILPHEHSLVFTNNAGGTFAHSNFRSQVWMPLLERAEMGKAGDEMHFHALRHFAASHMISNLVPITDVASLLGHSKVDMTLTTYAHPIIGGSRQRELLNRMTTGFLDTAV